VSVSVTEGTVELPDYFGIVKRRWLTILAVTVLGVGLGAAYAASQSKVYTSTAKVLLRPGAIGIVDTGTSTPMQTEVELATSPAVTRLADVALGRATTRQALLDHVSADSPEDTLVLEISYSYSDPETAQVRAGAIADAYLEFKARQIRQAAEQSGTENNFAVAGDIISPPLVPTSASSPNPPLDVGLGAFIGLFLGIVLAFVRERVDKRIRGRADVEDAVGAPVMAVIPPGKKPLLGIRALVGKKPAFPWPSLYVSLGAGILRRAEQSGMRTLLFLGATSRRVAAATAANLGVVLAQAGKRVLLVSGDIHTPRLHDFFGVQNDLGLAEFLAGTTTMNQIVQSTKLQDLQVVAAGSDGSGIELAHSERMQKLLLELLDVADVVILDSPPLLSMPDGLTLAPLVDGVILVADAATEKRPELVRARGELDAIGARVVGSVVVNLDPSSADAYDASVGRRSLALPQPLGRG
jgi:succinoglycan biosynthesis transport protein ExoP